MINALTKPVTEIKKEDLDELIQTKWPETENVEFKAELSRNRDGSDPWKAGNLSDQAKAKLFKEMVAFANTSGGRLFLGIGETTEGPPRADAIQPVPRCYELAERLEQSLASSIDPPLTFLRVFAVPTKTDGSGVIIVDVSASYSGPHRSPDRECYVRKGTISLPVGMREIHDMVMRLSRRQDEIRQRLSERQAAFHAWLGHGPVYQNLRVGFRVTAIPVGAPLYLDPVFRTRSVSRDLVDIPGRWVGNAANSRTDKFPPPLDGLSERRVLGGTLWSSDWQEQSAQQLILRDGLIETRFKMRWRELRSDQGEQPFLFFGWIVCVVANVLARVDSFRKTAQAPACEYGLQLELLSTNGPAECPVQLLRASMRAELGEPIHGPALLGPYSVGSRDEVLNLVVRDLYDASGEFMPPEKLEIGWPSD